MFTSRQVRSINETSKRYEKPQNYCSSSLMELPWLHFVFRSLAEDSRSDYAHRNASLQQIQNYTSLIPAILLQVQKDGQTVNCASRTTRSAVTSMTISAKNFSGEKVTVTGTASRDNGTNMLTAARLSRAKQRWL